jgi:Uncharacterized protein conserved in bacteria
MLDTLKKLLGQAEPPLPEVGEAHWARIEAGLPFLGHLAADERARLREMALEFIAQKEWHGAQGLVL